MPGCMAARWMPCGWSPAVHRGGAASRPRAAICCRRRIASCHGWRESGMPLAQLRLDHHHVPLFRLAAHHSPPALHPSPHPGGMFNIIRGVPLVGYDARKRQAMLFMAGQGGWPGVGRVVAGRRLFGVGRLVGRLLLGTAPAGRQPGRLMFDGTVAAACSRLPSPRDIYMCPLCFTAGPR